MTKAWSVASCALVLVAACSSNSSMGTIGFHGDASPGEQDAAETTDSAASPGSDAGSVSPGADAAADSAQPASGQDASARDGSTVTHPPPRPDAAATATFDGTTGEACTTDADCDGGAGINICSSDVAFMVNGVQVQLWPTPICIPNIPTGGGNCDPGPAGAVQFCDSADVNDATSPGICLALTNPQVAGAGNGICLPSCTFATDGSAQQGCVGHDTCNNFTFLLSQDGTTTLGFGFCQGTCQTDADCSALGSTWGCQADLGFCTQTKKTRTKAIGASCTNSGTTSDSSTGACNCFSQTGVTAGYCTSSCVVGGKACPDGFVCDALEQPTLTFQGLGAGGTDINLPGPPTQNAGLAGTCFQPCALPDAGSPSLRGTMCTQSTCTPGTLVGPDCLPQ